MLGVRFWMFPNIGDLQLRDFGIHRDGGRQHPILQGARGAAVEALGFFVTGGAVRAGAHGGEDVKGLAAFAAAPVGAGGRGHFAGWTGEAGAAGDFGGA